MLTSELLTRDGASAVERLDHWVATVPEESCFYDGERECWESYRSLGARSDSIAALLQGRGLQPGESVGVFATAPFAIATVLFGIWKAGAVFAPYNSSLRGPLLAYQVNDSRASVVFVQGSLAGEFQQVLSACPSIQRVILLDGPTVAASGSPPLETPFDASCAVERWSQGGQAAPKVRVVSTHSSPALIIYTSGTTGPSKGVVLPHGWVAQYTCVMRSILTRDDVIYNDLPMYHVGGAIANLVRAVWVGCRIACWERFSVSAFWARIRQSGATVAILLDTMIAWLTKAPLSDHDRLNTLNKVHMQPLPADHQRVARRFGFDLVTTGFGQTETGGLIHAFIQECPFGQGTPKELYRGLSPTELSARLAVFEARLIPPEGIPGRFLGQPAIFHELAVLDENDAPCLPGVAGELAVRPRVPHVVLKEYLGKPQATVAALRNVWFHTGDSVVRDSDGTFRFVGRLGDRMRVRGENVTAFDVEELMARHPSVSLCAALAVPAAEGSEDDIAIFVVPVAGADLTAQLLVEWAASSMPKYMRPRHYRIVADIPRTPSNKIEKYKLRAALLEELAVQSAAPTDRTRP